MQGKLLTHELVVYFAVLLFHHTLIMIEQLSTQSLLENLRKRSHYAFFNEIIWYLLNRVWDITVSLKPTLIISIIPFDIKYKIKK